MRQVQVVCFLSIATASLLPAQRLDDASVAAHRAVETTTLPSTPTFLVAPSQTSASTRSMVLGGIIGGALGAFGGAAVGISAENCDRSSSEDCGLVGAVLGGVLGEAIGVPLGVNWAANGSGTLKRTIPTSLALTAVCLLTGLGNGGASVIALPPIQIYTSIRAERTGSTGVLGW